MNKIREFTDFLKSNGYRNEIEEKDGRVEVGGYLGLEGTKIAELPENLTVGGYLDLRGTKIAELPENLTVGGDLDLRGTKIAKLPENLTVGGYLDLEGTKITELPENLTVGGSLYLEGTKIAELPENLTVGGSLDLRGTKIAELPENLTVGGYLDLRGTKIAELPENLTVGGYLDLEGTKITELPENLTVGGSLDLRGTKIIDRQKELKKVQQLCKGYNKEKKYIFFDGILWGNVKSVKKREGITIYRTPLGYCAVENENSAHGKTLKEAMDDLIFKKLKDENVEEIIEEIKRTGKVTRAQYRAITGACQFGTEQFCRKHEIENLEEIELDKLREILTPDNYGAKRFWSLIDGEEIKDD